MNVRGFGFDSYGWEDARAQLEEGIHPAVVAARLGESEDYVQEVAAERGWAITWQPGRKRWPLAADRVGRLMKAGETNVRGRLQGRSRRAGTPMHPRNCFRSILWTRLRASQVVGALGLFSPKVCAGGFAYPPRSSEPQFIRVRFAYRGGACAFQNAVKGFARRVVRGQDLDSRGLQIRLVKRPEPGSLTLHEITDPYPVSGGGPQGRRLLHAAQFARRGPRCSVPRRVGKFGP